MRLAGSWTCRLALVALVIAILISAVAIIEFRRLEGVLADNLCGVTVRRIGPAPDAKAALVLIAAQRRHLALRSLWCRAVLPFRGKNFPRSLPLKAGTTWRRGGSTLKRWMCRCHRARNSTRKKTSAMASILPIAFGKVERLLWLLPGPKSKR